MEEYIESRESEADLAAVKAVDYSPGKVLELYEEEKTKLEEAKKQIKKYEKLLTNPTLLRQIADDQTNKQEEEKLKEKLTRSQTLTRRR